jgi:hypothetical protein
LEQQDSDYALQSFLRQFEFGIAGTRTDTLTKIDSMNPWILVSETTFPDSFLVRFRQNSGSSRFWRIAGTKHLRSPHQDDEVLGCGGTLLRKQQAGAEMKIVLLSL